MLLPQPRIAAAWAAVVTTILTTLLGGSIAIAMGNLLHPRDTSWLAMAASVVWILLIVAILWGTCHFMGGVRRWLIRIVGTFASRQFIRVEEEASERLLALGFHLGGMTFYYRKVALGGILGVNWNRGQASYRSKKDLPNWSVAIWYDPQAVRLGITPDHLQSVKELDIIGHEGPREAIEQLGLEVVEFLRRRADVPLVVGGDVERMQLVRGNGM
jgi:hypothetical protein